MKTLFILNPSAAKGKSLNLKEEIEKEAQGLEIDFNTYISKSSQDIFETVKNNLNKYLNFIAVGGDGTIHYIANALAGTKNNLGVIPAGSGNDITKNMGLPMDIKGCCLAIKKCNIRRIDLGIINNQYYYLCIAGTGFDSRVNDLANNTRMPIKGTAKYTYSVYKTLLTFKPELFYIKYDSNNKKMPAMMIAASNMQSYGGGMKITPDAIPDDNLLDVCIIKRMNKIHFIKTFPKVFEGKHTGDPYVEIFRTDSISIDSNYKFSVFADGEYICKLPAVFKIVPKKLNFIVS